MTTHDRVRRNTPPHWNRQIREDTERRIAALREHPDQIRAQLDALDAEWDVERAVGFVSASLSLYGLAQAALGARRWLLLPAAVQGFLLQHAVRGWCPPLTLLRRAGFRTQQEIERERYSLRALLRDHVGDTNSDRPAELPGEPATGAHHPGREAEI